MSRSKQREPKKGITEKTKTNPAPERTCTGCQSRKPQCELLRVASREGSTPVVDKEFSAPGRGAYLCYDGACLQRARKRRAFERALKLRESVPHNVWDEIEKLISAGRF